ncbi:hypothetical protein H8A05_11360, partial [Neisseria meningitidis]|nr:hypothetical protein [Neisseria meningitidis]MBJ1840129.1 hypothetical protein [Neisseria meningitidis]MBJ7752211.1 hypothetical protein [Neisseria meningitidis]MBJ7781573.1 hypothetical protein [Neisseria meningitidis]MBJ7792130.1 hypothetical protein [Neisseria meningitidis]
ADGNRAFGDAAQGVVVKAVFEIDGHFGVSFFVFTFWFFAAYNVTTKYAASCNED